MDALLLLHGAGSDRDAPLLVALDASFAARGLDVTRANLPFRAARPTGPPGPADRAADVAFVRTEAERLRAAAGGGRVFVGGHSYGGRVASLAASDEPSLAAALLLLGYPLHPPRRPDEPRTAHWPALRTPCFFASGTRDPFGRPDEFAAAEPLLGARRGFHWIPEAGHDLRPRGRAPAPVDAVSDAFLAFVAAASAGL